MSHSSTCDTNTSSKSTVLPHDNQNCFATFETASLSLTSVVVKDGDFSMLGVLTPADQKIREDCKREYRDLHKKSQS